MQYCERTGYSAARRLIICALALAFVVGTGGLALAAADPQPSPLFEESLEKSIERMQPDYKAKRDQSEAPQTPVPPDQMKWPAAALDTLTPQEKMQPTIIWPTCVWSSCPGWVTCSGFWTCGGQATCGSTCNLGATCPPLLTCTAVTCWNIPTCVNTCTGATCLVGATCTLIPTCPEFITCWTTCVGATCDGGATCGVSTCDYTCGSTATCTTTCNFTCNSGAATFCSGTCISTLCGSTCLGGSTCSGVPTCPGAPTCGSTCSGPTCTDSHTCGSDITCPQLVTCDNGQTCDGTPTCSLVPTCHTGGMTCGGATCDGTETCDGAPTCAGSATCLGTPTCVVTCTGTVTCTNVPTCPPWEATCHGGATCSGSQTCTNTPTCDGGATCLGLATCFGAETCPATPTCSAATCEGATCTTTCDGLATCDATCPGIPTCVNTCPGIPTCSGTATCPGTATCSDAIGCQLVVIPIDILPGECPNVINAHIQRSIPRPDPPKTGPESVQCVPDVAAADPMIAVAVLGGESFDITELDAYSILLIGVSPMRHELADVSGPSPVEGAPCDCAFMLPDGWTDLVLWYNTEQIVDAIGPMAGLSPMLVVTGETKTAETMVGFDCVQFGLKEAVPLEVTTAATPQITVANYPNPFNASTTIAYTLADDAWVELTVFDVRGRRVASLIGEHQSTGPHAVGWDGRNEHGRSVATGVYFYRLTVGNQTVTKKMILLK